MGNFFSEEQKKEFEKQKMRMDFLINMLAESEGAPISFKLMRAHNDLTNVIHDYIRNPKFKEADDEHTKAIINILSQATELVKDAIKEMEGV